MILLIIMFSLMTSCYKVYDPGIDRAEKVLVVNGLITNKPGSYHIQLSYAEPFNSIEKSQPASNAIVYVTDDAGNSYKFTENTSGDYISDSLLFTASVGQKYMLHIITPDGQEYKSDTQRIFPEAYPESVHAEYDTKEALDQNSGLKVLTHGASILADVNNDSDTMPRYRITSDLVYQFYYKISMLLNWYTFLGFDFYCWQTVNANPDLNLTGGDHFQHSASIKNHAVCFLDDYYYVFARQYGLVLNMDDTTGTGIERKFQYQEIHHRILYVNQYTLNDDSYIYYKSLNDQIQAQGKLFDPIASQLNGNIRCISDPGKKVIGFFEASSVSQTAYIVDFRNLTDSQPTLTKTPYILPPEPTGYRINRVGSPHQDHKIPAFWIFT